MTAKTSETVSSMATPREDAVEVVEESDEVFDDSTYRFCLVESPEGDYPRLRMFNDAASLAKRLASLEGQDVAVWPFYGLPLSFTKLEGGAPRHLILPSGSALTIPTFPGQEPEETSSFFASDSDIQEDGFLGPPELVGEVVDGSSEDI